MGRNCITCYLQHVLQLKERTKPAARTFDRFRSMLPRINAAIGHIKLSRLRPQHLNELYENLGKVGVRVAGERAIPKPALNTAFLRAGISKTELSRRSGSERLVKQEQKPPISPHKQQKRHAKLFAWRNIFLLICPEELNASGFGIK